MAGSDRAIGKLDQPGRREETMTMGELFAVPLDPFGSLGESGSDRHRRTFHTHNAGTLEDRSLVRSEPLDLLFDQGAKIFRNAEFHTRWISLQCPVRLPSGDDLFAYQVFDGIDHEQGIAFGTPVNRPRQTTRKMMAGEPDGKVLRDRIFIQIFEGQFVAQIVRLQFSLNAFEGMIAENYFNRTVGSNDHQARRLAAAPQI